MNAGLPGTGIGGLFYVLTALMLPFIEVYHTVLGKSTWQRWRLAIRQALIAWGMLLGVEATGWLVRFLVDPVYKAGLLDAARMGSSRIYLLNNVLIAAPLVMASVTLLAVLSGISVMRVVSGRRLERTPPDQHGGFPQTPEAEKVPVRARP